MAISLVQITGGTTPSQAFGSNNTAGNLLICIFRGDAGAAVSDSQGNTWVKAVGQRVDGVDRDYDIWYAANCKAGANTVSVQNNISGFFANQIIAEYSGALTTSPLAQTNTAVNSGATQAYGPCSVTTTTPNALIIGGLSNGSTATGANTPTGGFTERFNITSTNAWFADQIGATAGLYTFGGSTVNATLWYTDVAVFLPAPPPTHSISGNAGVAGANVAYSGTASGNVTADGSGNYTIPSLSDGPYTITPSLASYTFSPTSASETLAGSNITGVNFTATAVSSVYSVPDCRDTSNWPNNFVTVQGTKQYTVQKFDSRKAGAPTDSRKAGAPVDSRVAPNIPENSRTQPPFES